MTDKFHNKYRIPSARLQNWDYRWAGAYFITICTQNREHYFGEIENGEMQLSPIGAIADEFMASISPKSDSVSTIIRSYKSAVTKHTHRLGFDFAWQTRFHDHIIRDNISFENIQTYINKNPIKWVDDKFYKQQ